MMKIPHLRENLQKEWVDRNNYRECRIKNIGFSQEQIPKQFIKLNKNLLMRQKGKRIQKEKMDLCGDMSVRTKK